MHPLHLAVALLASLAVACTPQPAADHEDPLPGVEEPDAGSDGAPDAGSDPVDGGGPDAGGEDTPGPAVHALQALGAYLPSPTRALLLGTDRALLGTHGLPVDPAWFGVEGREGTWEGWFRTGMIELNTRSGESRLFTEKDGVPVAPYVDLFDSYGEHTASFIDFVWLEKDVRFAAASWNFLVKGERTGSGWTFSKHPLRSPRSQTDAKVTLVAMAGGQLYAGSDQGVAVIDPTDMKVQRFVDFVSTTDPWVFSMVSGELDGQQVIAAAVGPQGLGEPTMVSLIRPNQPQSTNFRFDGGERPTALLGLPNAILVGVLNTDFTGALFRITESLGTTAMQPALSARDLSASPHGPLVPGRMAWDPVRRRVVIGGRLLAQTLSGGGLVTVAGSEDGTLRGQAEDPFPPDDRFRELLARDVLVLQVDELGRYWVAGRSLCSAHKLREAGLYRVEFFEVEGTRVVRPLLSGVRAIASDPDDGTLWLGLRDSAPGLACEGIQTMQGLCRLKHDGSCELFTPTVNAGSADVSANPGATAIAFGTRASREFALATRRDATFVRREDSSRALMTQIDPGVSLHMTRAAWGAPGALWLGSQKDYQPQVDPTLDDERIDDRSPHGLGYLELDGAAEPTLTRRYV
ncbi:MAG: hypothetical protein ACK4N5_09825, partial [Myxococcales bacterium]